MASTVKSFLIRALRELAEPPRSDLLQRRYDKFRRIGTFLEETDPVNGQLSPTA
jgi:acetyl-CoA carboxylase carboxyl transferase subunit alpha